MFGQGADSGPHCEPQGASEAFTQTTALSAAAKDTGAKKIGMREKHSKVAASRRDSLRASFITSIFQSRVKLGKDAFIAVAPGGSLGTNGGVTLE